MRINPSKVSDLCLFCKNNKCLNQCGSQSGCHPHGNEIECKAEFIPGEPMLENDVCTYYQRAGGVEIGSY